MTISIPERIKYVRHNRSKKNRKILLNKLEIAKRILVDEFHVKRIILFGSLLDGNAVHPFSDIDLVVEGLGKDYLKAGGRLIDTLGESIDIKPLEMLDEDFKKQVIESGKVIYNLNPDL